eukprot:COSAG02_NODE_1361_length_13053_cov_26.443956_4_plen_163_part_00
MHNVAHTSGCQARGPYSYHYQSVALAMSNCQVRLTSTRVLVIPGHATATQATILPTHHVTALIRAQAQHQARHGAQLWEPAVVHYVQTDAPSEAAVLHVVHVAQGAATALVPRRAHRHLHLRHHPRQHAGASQSSTVPKPSATRTHTTRTANGASLVQAALQ